MIYSILNNELDTICAISTPEGEGAISIIRISGSLAIDICNKILKFKFKNNANFTASDCELKKFYVCNIYDYFIDAVIDEAACVFIKSPNSYTGEDIVEIYPHGGVFNTRYILELIIKSGARLAYKGEFTKRAYINKKINLIQAESILEIIKATSVKSLLIANNELNGQLESKLNIIKDNFLYILASLEALIDFPEEEFEDINKMFLQKGNELKNVIEYMINSYNEYAANKQGLNVVIAGKPNAGKSSLLNKLLKKQRAIVSDSPGTTRDYIEESLFLFNKTLKIIDTAGLRISDDNIEKAGIDFTYEIIKKSDIILYLIDISKETDVYKLNEEDLEFIKNCDKNKKLILVFNKTDKLSKAALTERKAYIKEQIENKFGVNVVIADNMQNGYKYFVKNISGNNNININENISGIFFISIENDLNINALKKYLYDLMLNIESTVPENIAITTLRQKNLLEKSLHCLNNAINAFKNSEPYEIISIELRDGINYLENIIGNVTNEDVLDTLFKEFCIGK
jgi:tRNA modification GTPase